MSPVISADRGAREVAELLARLLHKEGAIASVEDALAQDDHPTVVLDIFAHTEGVEETRTFLISVREP